MAKVGYARVSSKGQDLALQIEKLESYGCSKIFKEKTSGANSHREQLQAALDYLREGDELVCYKIDRLARSTFDLLKISQDLQEKNINLVFMKEQIDFSTPSGKIMLTMLGAIAEFERDIINERAHEGRERAKKQGKHMGRPGKSEKDIQRALKLYSERKEKELTVQDIVRQTGVPRSTIYQKIQGTKEQEKLNK